MRRTSRGSWQTISARLAPINETPSRLQRGSDPFSRRHCLKWLILPRSTPAKYAVAGIGFRRLMNPASSSFCFEERTFSWSFGFESVGRRCFAMSAHDFGALVSGRTSLSTDVAAVGGTVVVVLGWTSNDVVEGFIRRALGIVVGVGVGVVLSEGFF